MAGLAAVANGCGDATQVAGPLPPPAVTHIVNLDHVERMRLLDNGRVEVQMKDGATVPVSRIRSQELRRLSR